MARIDDLRIQVDIGDHFDMIFPDGTVLNVEQTSDYFSIVDAEGNVIFTKNAN